MLEYYNLPYDQMQAALAASAGNDAAAETEDLTQSDEFRRLQGRRLRDAPVHVQEIRQQEQIDLSKPYEPPEEEPRRMHMVSHPFFAVSLLKKDGC